jgi:hypothetical protein
VSWQEELRSLDAELAERRIAPAEYRRRRDNLLAAASGGLPPTTAPFSQHAPDQQQQPHQAVPPWSPVTELPMYQPRPTLDEDIFNVRMTKPGKSRSALALVVVVVAVLLLAGGWWFGVRPAMDAASTTTALHLDDLPTLPGTTRLDRAELSVFEGQNRGLFDSREADFLTNDKVSQVTFTGSADGKLNYVVYAFVTDSPANGGKVAAALLSYQKLGGLTAADQVGLPDKMKVVKLVAGDQIQYRAIYASGVNAVLVAAAQARPADESTVATALHDVAASVLSKAPAS